MGLENSNGYSEGNKLEEIKIRGRVLKKDHVLNSPDLYKDETLIILRVSTNYYYSLVNFAKENDITNLEVSLRSTGGKSERARRFFFALRDRLAEQSGDTSKSYKDHLYRACIRELRIFEEGMLVDSIKNLDRKQLWTATERMLDWCVQAECNLTDLLPELEELRNVD